TKWSRWCWGRILFGRSSGSPKPSALPPTPAIRWRRPALNMNVEKCDEIGLWKTDPGAPDYELICVEPGSPMGELMRRYWQPVCTSDELRDLPRKEKLLCEEIVPRQKGRVGALAPHCAHRGTSLEWGRIEEEGLRCCYHGWLYDAQGRCIDMPCETEEFRKAMANQRIPTGAWNTILSPAEAAALPYSEHL